MIFYSIEQGGSITADGFITTEQALEAAEIVKRYCMQRDPDSPSCCDCPIRDLCGTEPYAWNLKNREAEV